MEDLEGFLLLFIQKVRANPSETKELITRAPLPSVKNLRDEKNKKEGHKRPSFLEIANVVATQE